MTLEDLYQFENQLNFYSRQELIDGRFLFLDEFRNYCMTPKSYKLFRAYLILAKRFNEANEDFIKEQYLNYCLHLQNKNENISLISSKSMFNRIFHFHEHMFQQVYWEERGYSSIEAKTLQKMAASHMLKKEENLWYIFINGLKLQTAKLNSNSASKLERLGITNAIGIVKQRKINAFLINHRAKPSGPSVYNLLFDNYNNYLKDPLGKELFLSTLQKEIDVNSNNKPFIDFLYEKYISNFFSFDFLKKRNYLSYHSFFDFQIKVPSTLSINFWLIRGWSEDESKQKISELQSNNSLSLNHAIEKYGEEEGRNRYQKSLEKFHLTRQQHKDEDQSGRFGKMFSKAINPETGELYNYETMIQLGQQLSKDHLKLAGKANAQRIKNGELHTVWQKEYWMEQGFSEEEAKQKVSDLMPKNGLDNYIKKYGNELGTQKYEARIKQYKETMSSKSDEEKLEIKKKRTIIPHKTSKAANNFFNKVINQLKLENIEIDYSRIHFDKNEQHLFDKEKNTIYFYDFCINELMIIVEFNGIMYHPKDNLTNEELKNWKSLFYNVPGEVQRERDRRKKELAEQLGYTYLIVWEDENQKDAQNKIINLIKEKLNSKI